MNRIPGPYQLDVAGGLVHNDEGDTIAYRPLCFEDPDGHAPDVRNETLRFFVAAANFCAHLPIDFMEEIVRDDRTLEMALHLSNALGAGDLTGARARILKFSDAHRRHRADETST